MSWLDPFGISFDRLLEQYPEKTYEEVDRMYWERKEILQMRYEMDTNYFKLMKDTKQNFPTIDSPDESFHFFIEHPMEVKAYLYDYSARMPLTKLTKQQVFDKCEGQCVSCHKQEDLQIHHIDGDHGNVRLGNLELRCYACHKKLHKVQGHSKGGRRYKK